MIHEILLVPKVNAAPQGNEVASVSDTVNSKRRKRKISHVVYSDNKRIKTLLQDTNFESLLKDLV